VKGKVTYTDILKKSSMAEGVGLVAEQATKGVLWWRLSRAKREGCWGAIPVVYGVFHCYIL
jgi:hypothetical protein